MLNKHFFISWIFSALVMFGAFYMWHGVLLADIKILTSKIPLSMFLVFASVAYLAIGALVARVFTIEYFKKYTRHLFIRGLLCGALLGFLIFIVTLVTGISFVKNTSSSFVFVDMTWQIIEQALGGLAVGLVHAFVWDDSMMRHEDID